MTSRLPRVIRGGLFLFRRLMALMPDSYTSEQREDAIQLSVTLATETRDRRGTLAAMRVTLRVLCDLVGQVMRERLRPVDRRIIDDRRSFADRLRLILDTIGRDIRDGFRAAVARPGQSAAIVATLALGIGLNAAVFSVVDWVLLRPLPYPEPELLARVWTADKASAGVPSDVTYSELERLSRTTSFQAAAGFSTITSVMTSQDLEPGHVVVVRMTGDLFRVFGTYPVVGRPFDATELETGRPVAVVSESVWRNRLSADRAVVGRLITLDAKQYTIAGVMPAHRGYPTAADVWRPSTAPEREDDDRENVMVARMRADVDEAGATSELNTLVSSFTRNLATERTVHLERLQATEVRNVRTALTWVFAAAALVLLVACLNVASLAGARGSERAGELAVRGALGAGRLQLVRQLMVESVMLASLGGAIGVALGAGVVDLVVAVAPGAMPRLDEVSLDGRVISVSAIVILMVGVLVGTAPAWRATRVDLRRVLVSAGTPRASSPAGTRRVLVVVQMIAAVVLTVGAGLLARSFQQLMAIDHGFDPDRLLAINLNLRGVPPGDAPGLFNALIETAQGVPGVQSATAAFRVPTQIEGLRVPVRIESAAMRDSQATLRVVMPGYFDMMAIRLREGRSLATTDTRPSPRVAVVNESFVRDVLGGLPAINTAFTTDLVDQRVTIVGVVSDVTPQGQPDRPALYVSFHQFAINAGSLLVRTHGDPAGVLPTLRRRLRTSAPTLALDRTLIMNDALAAGRSVTRFNTLLASSFGVLALILAVIGIYGLASGDVEARRFEAGLRTALGATPRDIVWGLVRPMGTLLLIGLVGGIATAGAVASSMRSLFYGISPGDPITFVVIPLFIALCGASATLIASRPLLRANPVMTLRR